MNPAPDSNSGRMTGPFGLRDFRLLWIGESISLLGDQFYLIALPWLVLQLTGSAFALGAAMALASVPRATFMLIGGASVDRRSPRAILMASNLSRLVLVSLMAVLVLVGHMKIEALYLFALLFGLADAFYYPAQGAILPQVLPPALLGSGNGYVQGATQLSVLLGPALAGGLIAFAGRAGGSIGEAGASSSSGIGIALTVDALSFLASLATLAMMRRQGAGAKAASTPRLAESLKEGLTHVRESRVLRVLFGLIMVVNFMLAGPVAVGIPVLASARHGGGSATFGLVMSAFGAGSLAGILLSKLLPAPRPSRLGAVILLATSVLGLGIAALPLVSSSTVALVLVALGMGAAVGCQKILTLTWLQQHIPQALMGRVMSLLLFSTIGLAPLSNALSGALMQAAPSALFIVAGLLLATLVPLFLRIPEIRRMGLEPPTNIQGGPQSR